MTAVGEAEYKDYSGAIYGSLLAASVVAGTSPGEDYASPEELAVLLVATGLVFWLAHVYAQLFGGAEHGPDRLAWENVHHVAAGEWPMVAASIPPALAALVGVAFGLSDIATSWLCLTVALSGLTGWAVVAAVAAGIRGHLIALSVLVSFSLGAAIIALKVSLAQ
jgi:hypothetical protein